MTSASIVESYLSHARGLSGYNILVGRRQDSCWGCWAAGADHIHIAINLNGYTKGTRNKVCALLPAPVQTSYMGFPASTGAPFLSYHIADHVLHLNLRRVQKVGGLWCSHCDCFAVMG